MTRAHRGTFDHMEWQRREAVENALLEASGAWWLGQVIGWMVDDQLPLGDYRPGRWGWMLTDHQPCQPVPCTGQRGVFMLPDDVTTAIHEAS